MGNGMSIIALKSDPNSTRAIKAETVDITQFFGQGNRKLTKRAAYNKQAWLRRCVHFRSSQLANIPWQIRRGESVVWDSAEEQKPDELRTLHDLRRFLYLSEASLALEHKAYMLKLKKLGVFTGLQWWNPLTVTPTYHQGQDRTGIPNVKGMKGFEKNSNNIAKPYKKQDVLHIFAPDPYCEIGPSDASDAESARVHADVLNNAARFADRYLDRGMVRATVVTVPKGTSEREKGRLKTFFTRFFGGAKNAGEFGVFNADAINAQTIGEGLKDLADVHLTEDQAKAISAGMNIPYSLIAPDAANFATKQGDQEDFYYGTVIPQARLIQSAFNTQLFEALGFWFVFQPERLPFFQNKQVDQAKTIILLTGGKPILTQQEGREMIGKTGPLPKELQQAPPPQFEPSEDEEEPLTEEAIQEIKNWKRKATRKGNKPFEAQHIPLKIASTIKLRLDLGEPVDEAFRPPFGSF